MEQDIDDALFKAVLKFGVHVEKDELIKALKYDRGQYDKGYEDGYHNASEVMRKIFRKIRGEIIEARNSNFEVIREREEKHGVNRYEDGFCMYCDGKIHALDGIYYFIDELESEVETTNG
jgi:hypothetical protein